MKKKILLLISLPILFSCGISNNHTSSSSKTEEQSSFDNSSYSSINNESETVSLDSKIYSSLSSMINPSSDSFIDSKEDSSLQSGVSSNESSETIVSSVSSNNVVSSVVNDEIPSIYYGTWKSEDYTIEITNKTVKVNNVFALVEDYDNSMILFSDGSYIDYKNEYRILYVTASIEHVLYHEVNSKIIPTDIYGRYMSEDKLNKLEVKNNDIYFNDIKCSSFIVTDVDSIDFVIENVVYHFLFANDSCYIVNSITNEEILMYKYEVNIDIKFVGTYSDNDHYLEIDKTSIYFDGSYIEIFEIDNNSISFSLEGVDYILLLNNKGNIDCNFNSSSIELIRDITYPISELYIGNWSCSNYTFEVGYSYVKVNNEEECVISETYYQGGFSFDSDTESYIFLLNNDKSFSVSIYSTGEYLTLTKVGGNPSIVCDLNNLTIGHYEYEDVVDEVVHKLDIRNDKVILNGISSSLFYRKGEDSYAFIINNQSYTMDVYDTSLDVYSDVDSYEQYYFELVI